MASEISREVLLLISVEAGALGGEEGVAEGFVLGDAAEGFSNEVEAFFVEEDAGTVEGFRGRPRRHRR